MTEYTVGEVARASGVTVRTLHHYDDLGLLPPTGRTTSGYRLYSETDVRRLHHIRTYQAVGLSLEEIAGLLDGPEDHALSHLRRQHELVGRRIDDLHRVLRMIDSMMEALVSEVRLTPEEIFEVFGEHDPNAYSYEVEQRWGTSDAFAESLRRTRGYGASDWKALKAEAEQIESAFANLKDAGTSPDSTEAMDVAERHRLHIQSWFYDCPPQLHCDLADMYVQDPRFTAHYDDRVKGLAGYVHDAIWANAARSSGQGQGGRP